MTKRVSELDAAPPELDAAPPELDEIGLLGSAFKTENNRMAMRLRGSTAGKTNTKLNIYIRVLAVWGQRRPIDCTTSTPEHSTEQWHLQLWSVPPNTGTLNTQRLPIYVHQQPETFITTPLHIGMPFPLVPAGSGKSSSLTAGLNTLNGWTSERRNFSRMSQHLSEFQQRPANPAS
jgi:hypothetical protein